MKDSSGCLSRVSKNFAQSSWKSLLVITNGLTHLKNLTSFLSASIRLKPSSSNTLEESFSPYWFIFQHLCKGGAFALPFHEGFIWELLWLLIWFSCFIQNLYKKFLEGRPTNLISIRRNNKIHWFIFQHLFKGGAFALPFHEGFILELLWLLIWFSCFIQKLYKKFLEGLPTI